MFVCVCVCMCVRKSLWHSFSVVQNAIYIYFLCYFLCYYSNASIKFDMKPSYGRGYGSTADFFGPRSVNFLVLIGWSFRKSFLSYIILSFYTPCRIRSDCSSILVLDVLPYWLILFLLNTFLFRVDISG